MARQTLAIRGQVPYRRVAKRRRGRPTLQIRYSRGWDQHLLRNARLRSREHLPTIATQTLIYRHAHERRLSTTVTCPRRMYTPRVPSGHVRSPETHRVREWPSKHISPHDAHLDLLHLQLVKQSNGNAKTARSIRRSNRTLLRRSRLPTTELQSTARCTSAQTTTSSSAATAGTPTTAIGRKRSRSRQHRTKTSSRPTPQ